MVSYSCFYFEMGFLFQKLFVQSHASDKHIFVNVLKLAVFYFHFTNMNYFVLIFQIKILLLGYSIVRTVVNLETLFDASTVICKKIF